MAEVKKRAKRGKKQRKVGRKARQASFLRWKDRFNRNQGLKHRRARRKEAESNVTDRS